MAIVTHNVEERGVFGNEYVAAGANHYEEQHQKQYRYNNNFTISGKKEKLIEETEQYSQQAQAIERSWAASTFSLI
ncbi:hypothetical protein Hanom_Chr05g00402531 [Helianthus anomalus]